MTGKKYYPNMKYRDVAQDECEVRRKPNDWNNIRIGSLTCQLCSHCRDKGKSDGKFWIICDVIDKATGKKEPA